MEQNKQLDSSLLYEIRLVIMLETAPQSNTYEQIMFDADSLKEIRKFIESKMPRCSGHNHIDGSTCMAIITNSDNQCKLPSELKTSYPIEEIK